MAHDELLAGALVDAGGGDVEVASDGTT